MNNKNILIINGPNLNMLGKREPEVYGSETLNDLNKGLKVFAKKLKVDLEFFQSNHEGEIVEKIQKAYKKIDCIIINPAAYTHTSIAIRDALLSVSIPVIEVHLSNIYKREGFRKKSFIADISVGQITGFGSKGYFLAMEAAVNL